MAPRKRKSVNQDDQTLDSDTLQPENQRKLSRAQRGMINCKSRLTALEREENISTEDRFTQSEKTSLLEAYNRMGFQVFQDMCLLRQYLPNRTERDLKGLIDRLKLGLQQDAQADNDDKSCSLDSWLRLCHDLMGNFARDKRVNLDEALADALKHVADEQEQDSGQRSDIQQQDATRGPDYPELLRNFSQLLIGKFPNMTPENARISSKLFDHISNIVDSMNLDVISTSLESGLWLQTSKEERCTRQEMAIQGLEELDNCLKKNLTVKDLKNKNIEALCLELPKIRRITELLNPLNINDSLLNSLIDCDKVTST